MKRLVLLALLAGCVAEPVVVAPPVALPPVEEPRRQFVDDNIPFDLTAGADLTAIPDHWVEIFCTQPWESRAEPFTGIEQWNPCLRPDMYNDGPRVVAEPVLVAAPALPTAPVAEPEALALADPLARVREILEQPVPESATQPVVQPAPVSQTAAQTAAQTVVQPEVQVVPQPVPAAVPARPVEVDIAPDPSLFLNRDGSFSRRSQ